MPNELWCFDLSAGAVAVYIYLLRHADRRTNQCYPSEVTMAKSLHLARNTVAKYHSNKIQILLPWLISPFCFDWLIPLPLHIHDIKQVKETLQCLIFFF